MEAIYGKIKDMLNAYYPVLYLTSFEYDRTKQKIDGIINSLKSDKKEVRLFNWNCVEGLNECAASGKEPIVDPESDETIVEASEALKYVLKILTNRLRIFSSLRTCQIILRKTR